MNDNDKNGAHPSTTARDVPHRWLSNPLDWAQIDRMILLAGLMLLVPLAHGGGLLATLLLAPEWLHADVAHALLALFGAQALALATFLALAFRRRRSLGEWSLFENYIIGSYLAVTFIEAWLSGTQYTLGVLLLFIGLTLTSALADIRKIRLAYFVVCGVLVLFAAMESSGEFRHAPLFTRPPYNPDGSPVHGWFIMQFQLVVVLLAISYISILAIQRWVSRENLYREMSTIDGLTRLTNRRSFIERSECEFSRAQRGLQGTEISCIMIDIDHFKTINDTHGHPAGDAVLVQTSAVLQRCARQYDEVGRYGGEEFAILLPATPLAAAVQVAERLRTAIAANEITVEGKRLRVTASFGVACYPGEGIESINGLLKAADEALYAAKHGGRNRVVAAPPA